MTIETLDRKIEAKAREEAQAATYKFKETICRALRELLVFDFVSLDDTDGRDALLMVMGEKEAKWPERIQRVRENRLRQEIMSTMDTLQKVLLVKED
ncbi:hypothetical protein LCGC14_2289830 [marine sediment metagenome]|uniref:Uncharacterized protein n=1 Tax=marine sediment metagenome TaxID=412755 RepID=A0A0F9F442_9ZZZZ